MNRCQCPHCAHEAHASDCAVHNAPVLPIGDCTCKDEAFQRGFRTDDLLSNPYTDSSPEARRFVDGWVSGRKWAPR